VTATVEGRAAGEVPADRLSRPLACVNLLREGGVVTKGSLGLSSTATLFSMKAVSVFVVVGLRSLLDGLRLHERRVDQVLRDEPGLELVRSQHLGDQQVVGAVVSDGVGAVSGASG
jgi:hypothetical protein